MSPTPATFATQSRIHIGLEVADRDRAVSFYRLFLDAEPVKERPGYAKFELADPPVNLSLIENPSHKVNPNPGSLHYGIQVKRTRDVKAMVERLQQAGMPTRVEEQETCCYAVQTIPI